MARPDGRSILVSVHGEVIVDHKGRPELLRGSVQDITERRAAEEALSLAAANAEAAAREHAIADQLQRSLLPQPTVELEHLEVATYYRAGVEGTQVGGDWYDVIELGAGRTALVVGDVMGRGVQAAAVMGQLRAAIRAYARLDLPPADLLEYLDGIVREFGQNQIVTCLYAVFDPAGRMLRLANAGHLPPILVSPDRVSQILWGAQDPPLGAGPFVLAQQDVKLEAGSSAVLYTDGLVERRGEDLELGVHALARLTSEVEETTTGMPERLVQALLPDGPDDDVAAHQPPGGARRGAGPWHLQPRKLRRTTSTGGDCRSSPRSLSAGAPVPPRTGSPCGALCPPTTPWVRIPADHGRDRIAHPCVRRRGAGCARRPRQPRGRPRIRSAATFRST